MAEEPRPWNLDFAGSSSVQLKTRIRSVLAESRKLPRWLLGLRAALGFALVIGFLAIAPSLFIVLSYQQHRIAQPANLTSLVAPVKVQRRERSERTNHILEFPPPARAKRSNPPVVPEIPPNPPVEAVAADIPLRYSNAKLSNEPTLKRRGDEAPQKSNHGTTIRLSGQSPTYSGGPGGQQRTLDSILTTITNVSDRGHGDRDGH